MLGSVYVTDEPAWLWTAGKIINYMLYPQWMTYIKLPNWRKKQRVEYDPRILGWAEWYVTLSSVWSTKVMDRFFSWWWTKHLKYEVKIKLDYQTLQKLFVEVEPMRFKIRIVEEVPIDD